jgi:NitT/TauT family transport system substrate-binding protein
MTTRRKFISGLAAGAAITACPAIIPSARAAEPVVLMTPFGFDVDFIDFMNAYSGGHFARAGLDAKVLGATGTVQQIQMVVTDQAQFGRFSGIDFIRAVAAKDAPLKAFATINQNSGFTIVSLKEKPVKSGADLRGKTIGILSYGGTTETMIDVLLAKAGVPKAEAKLVVAGNSPGEVELIRQGRIDCFICTFSTQYKIRLLNEPCEYLSVDIDIPAPGQVYHATRTTIETKPDLVRKVLRATRASIEEIMTQPLKPIFERAGKDFEIPGMKDVDGLVGYEKTAIANGWLGEGKENLLRNLPRRWEAGAAALRQVGIVDVKDTTPLYTNKFVDEL